MMKLYHNAKILAKKIGNDNDPIWSIGIKTDIDVLNMFRVEYKQELYIIQNMNNYIQLIESEMREYLNESQKDNE